MIAEDQAYWWTRSRLIAELVDWNPDSWEYRVFAAKLVDSESSRLASMRVLPPRRSWRLPSA